jgi:hypothetical protein
MTELAEQAAASESLANDAASQMTMANKYALHFLADARNVWLDEMLFAGNEVLDRAITETKLFNEFISKMAGAHSMKDLGAVYQECTRHQLDFIRRDAERLVKHGERVIDNTSKLVETLRQN